MNPMISSICAALPLAVPLSIIMVLSTIDEVGIFFASAVTLAGCTAWRSARTRHERVMGEIRNFAGNF